MTPAERDINGYLNGGCRGNQLSHNLNVPPENPSPVNSGTLVEARRKSSNPSQETLHGVSQPAPAASGAEGRSRTVTELPPLGFEY